MAVHKLTTNVLTLVLALGALAGPALAAPAVGKAKAPAARTGATRAPQTQSSTALAPAPVAPAASAAVARSAASAGNAPLGVAAPESVSSQLIERVARAEKAWRADTTSVQKRFELGNAYYDSGRLLEAEASFMHVLERDSTFWKSWVNLGTVREDLNNAASAQVAFETAIRLQPRETFPRVKYANSLYASNHIYDAIEQYRKALSLDPKCLEALFMLGNAFAEQEMYREAVIQWKRVQAAGAGSDEARMAGDNLETIYSFFADQPAMQTELRAIGFARPARVVVPRAKAASGGK